MPALATYAAALVAVVALLIWHTGDVALTLRIMGASVLAAATLAGSGWLLVLGLARLRHNTGVAWRHGIANLARRRGETVVQITGFGLGITVLLLLGLVREDLLGQWQASLGEDSPNQFLVNIQTHERDALAALLAERGIEVPEFYPMVRARLSAHNDRTVRAEDYDSDRARRMALREFNLSWAAEIPEDNRLTAGEWWHSEQHGAAQISVEEDLAARLGMQPGDRLTFDVAGETLEVTITNLREVRWDTFNVNFFTLVPPGVLEDYPATWITSFHLPDDKQQLLPELIREFPGVGVIDIGAILDQVREVVARVSLTVQYVFGFTLFAGIAVLLATVQATRTERRRESALMRALGARRGTVLRGLAAEFTALGLIAGTVATLAAWVIGLVLARELFAFTYTPGAALFIIGIAGAALGIGAAGVAATRPVLNQAPMRTLAMN